ncbi:MAG: ATP-binding protein [Candidatus Doudnabacteria bacterium]
MSDTNHPAETRFSGRRWVMPNLLPLGFGIVLVLWVASSYDFTRRLEDVEQRTTAIIGRFVQSERLLSSIQVQLLLGSLYLRDAIADTPTTDDYYRQQLQASRAQIDTALQDYKPMLDSPEEQRVFGTLRGEITDFWSLVGEVLTTRGTRSSMEARVELRRRVIPKRDLILNVLEQVQTLHRGAFDAQRTEVSRVYGGMRTRVWTLRVIVFILSLGAAVLVTLYRARLEAQVQRQIERDAEHTRDLQRLSARLVQAQEDERRSIARELHDEIGQSLTAAKMELTLAKRAYPVSPPGGPLDELESITDRTIQTVRDLSLLLHPSLLDDLGLGPALDWQATSFSKRTGIRVEVVLNGMDERLSAEIETSVYRIVQEALNNVAKHSGATECTVDIERSDRELTVTVRDNGRGFDRTRWEGQPGRRGLGLIGIQERVSGFGGRFEIEGNAQTGTRLRVVLPALPATRPDAVSEIPTVVEPASEGAPR